MRSLLRLAVCSAVLLFAVPISSSAAEVTTLNPESIVKPYKARFSHGKLVPAGADWLVTAGQTGVNPDGVIGKDIEQQADWAMSNLFQIVSAAGMTSDDIVKITIFYTDPSHLPIIVVARNRYFRESFRPASSAVGVSSLVRPEYLVEVEALAARMPVESAVQ